MSNGWESLGLGPAAEAVAEGKLDGFVAVPGAYPEHWPGGFLGVVEFPLRGGEAVLLLREDAIEDYAPDEASLRKLAEAGEIAGEGPKQVLTLGPARAVSQLRRLRFQVSFAGVRFECWARSGLEMDTIRSYLRLHLPGAEVELLSSPLLPSFRIPKPGQIPSGRRRMGLLMLILGCLLVVGAPYASGKSWLTGPLAAAVAAIAASAWRSRKA